MEPLSTASMVRGLSRLAVAMLALLLASHLLGCGQQQGKAKDKPNSTTSRLELDDYDKFQPGRSMDDVLTDVQWKGNLAEAAEINGKRVYVIDYAFFGGIYHDDPRARILGAIFVDEKFEKFVELPVREKWRPFKLDDHRYLIRTYEGKVVNLAELAKEEPRPRVQSQPDYGLSFVIFVLSGPMYVVQQREMYRNTQLRDQFNASRLRLGMTEKEVESILKAKPLLSGKVDAGTFAIYGSTENVNLIEDIHYTNIVVLYKNGVVDTIYSGCYAPGGENSLQELSKMFDELPAVKVDQK